MLLCYWHSSLTFPKQLDKFTEEKPSGNIKGKGTSRCQQQTPGPQAAGIWKSIALCLLGFFATLHNSRSAKNLLGQQLLPWATTLAWSSVATCTFQRIFNHCGHWPALGKLSRKAGPHPSPQLWLLLSEGLGFKLCTGHCTITGQGSLCLQKQLPQS